VSEFGTLRVQAGRDEECAKGPRDSSRSRTAILAAVAVLQAPRRFGAGKSRRRRSRSRIVDSSTILHGRREKCPRHRFDTTRGICREQGGTIGELRWRRYLVSEFVGNAATRVKHPDTRPRVSHRRRVTARFDALRDARRRL